MNGPKIKELRQQGELDEALTLALNDLKKDPDNIWSKRNLAWVYDDYCELYAKAGDVSYFKEYFCKLTELINLADEKMLSNTLCWRIRSLLKSCDNKLSEKQMSQLCDELFVLCKHISPDKPSVPYSVLLDTFYKLRDVWSGFTVFCEWWGWDNFSSADYERATLSNGKKMPLSLAESVYIAYAKQLLTDKNKDAIKLFEPLLDKMEELYPEMMYISYYHCKCLLMLGDKENAIESILPFAKKKHSDFWIWQLMAEVVSNDEEKVLACLMRAVNCKTSENFLVKVRQQLAHFLYRKGDYAGARYHIDKYIKHRTDNGELVFNDVLQWIKGAWYTEAKGESMFKNLDYMYITNALLMEDVPGYIAVVVNVNKEKGMATIIYGKEKKGFFRYSSFFKMLTVGTFLKISYSDISNTGYMNLISASITDELPSVDFFRTEKGVVKINNQHGIGFLNSCFIPQSLCESAALHEGESVKADVFYEYNLKKNEWGWKCLKINKV